MIADRVDGDRIIAAWQQRVQSDARVLLYHTADVSVTIVGVHFVITQLETEISYNIDNF